MTMAAATQSKATATQGRGGEVATARSSPRGTFDSPTNTLPTTPRVGAGPDLAANPAIGDFDARSRRTMLSRRFQEVGLLLVCTQSPARGFAAGVSRRVSVVR